MTKMLLGIVLFFVAFSYASEAKQLSLSDYFTETWSTHSGLPHNSINSVVQTQDGYIWIATWEGLARFNGREFQLFTRTEIANLPDSGLRSLVALENGDLYIAGARGSIALRQDERWHTLPKTNAMVNHVLKTSSNELWLALEGKGVVYRHSSTLEDVTLLADISVYRLLEDNDGVIWAATSRGLYKIKNKQVYKIPASDGLPDASIFTLLLTRSGHLLVGGEQGAWRLHNGRFKSIHTSLDSSSISSLLEDHRGDLWFGTINKGVFRLSDLGLENLDADDGLPTNRILSLVQDREKSIWVGTNGGLFRLREAPFIVWDQNRGLVGNYIRTVLSHSDNSIWVGSSNGLNHIVAGQVSTIEQVYNEEPLSILSLVEDNRGDVWLGTYTDGLMKVVENKIYPAKNRDNGLISNEIRALLFDSKKQLWVGTASGLNMLNEAGEITSYTVDDGLPGNFIIALSEDAVGNIWVGTGVGVALFNVATKQFKVLRFPSEFSAEYAFGFYLDQQNLDNQYMWLATDRGLIRYRFDDETMALFGREQGLVVDKLFQVTEQGESLWLTSNRGVIQVNKHQLNKLLDNPNSMEPMAVSKQLYDEGDGMLSAQANGGSNPAAMVHNDGSLWVATAKGVATIFPERLKEVSKQALSTVIEEFRVDGKRVDVTSKKQPIKLDAGVSRLSFQYAGLSFIMPQRLNYQTQLSGYNIQWVNRGSRTITEYTNLAPGKYTFKVRSGYPNSQWQDNQQSFTFIIAPYFWQKMSFKVAVFILLVIGSYGFYRYRLYHFKQIEAELTHRVNQQTHDLKNQADAFAHQANHDQLTQLPNRRAFDLWLAENFTLFKEQQKPLALAIVDIDHFKLVNDGWSHLVGDKVICEVANILLTHTQHAKQVSRWGGEEFTLLFPEMQAKQAYEYCELLREFISNYDFSAIAEGLNITVSIGIADNCQVQDYDRMLAYADKALYLAKGNGRDEVVVASKFLGK